MVVGEVDDAAVRREPDAVRPVHPAEQGTRAVGRDEPHVAGHGRLPLEGVEVQRADEDVPRVVDRQVVEAGDAVGREKRSRLAVANVDEVAPGENQPAVGVQRHAPTPRRFGTTVSTVPSLPIV